MPSPGSSYGNLTHLSPPVNTFIVNSGQNFCTNCSHSEKYLREVGAGRERGIAEPVENKQQRVVCASLFSDPEAAGDALLFGLGRQREIKRAALARRGFNPNFSV